MPKLAANLSTLFPGLDFLERFAAARAAGFRYVEYQFPYEYKAEQLAERARDAGVQVVLHNLPAGAKAKGERGIACLPDRTAEFKSGVKQAIEYATALGVPQVNCLAGKAPDGVAVRPTIRASKYSITSVKRLKIERCASSKMIRSKKPGLNLSKHRLIVCNVAT